jgi:Mg2+-importing ATPase
LKAADVGISVNCTVDIAKESSHIIQLETNLMVLERGDGRPACVGNISKYINMPPVKLRPICSACWGEFIPALSTHAAHSVLTNNLLYVFFSTRHPQRFGRSGMGEKTAQVEICSILKFIVFIGPAVDFDYLTYFHHADNFNSWQTRHFFSYGFFNESLFTQTLIVHVIRTNKIPFFKAGPARNCS